MLSITSDLFCFDLSGFIAAAFRDIPLVFTGKCFDPAGCAIV
jgi:hypothetical protein